MTTVIEDCSPRTRAPRASRNPRMVVVALLASVGLLLGWAAPAGAHGTPARVIPGSVAGANVGHAPATAARAMRSALAGVAVRATQQGVSAQRAVRDTTGRDRSLPLPALLGMAVGIAAAVRGGALRPRVGTAALRIGFAAARRDRAPPACSAIAA